MLEFANLNQLNYWLCDIVNVLSCEDLLKVLLIATDRFKIYLKLFSLKQQKTISLIREESLKEINKFFSFLTKKLTDIKINLKFIAF